MELCFNELTLGKNGSLPNDIRLCAQAGFRKIELRKGNVLKYLRNGGSIEQLRSIMREEQVTPVNMCAIEGISFLSKPSMRTLKELADWTFSACKAIGCPCVEVIASFGIDGVSTSDINAETVQALLQLSDLSANYGINLALEFMAVPNSSVKSFDQCLEIIDTVNRDNVGMLLDTWHFYAAGAKPDDILKMKGSQLFMLHISDCPERLPFTAIRSESYWPGDGVIPLEVILKNLNTIGYNGMCSLEAVGQEMQNMPAAKCISLAKEKMEQLMRQANVWESNKASDIE